MLGAKVFGDCPYVENKKVIVTKPTCREEGKTSICNVHNFDIRSKLLKQQIPQSYKTPLLVYLLFSTVAFGLIVGSLNRAFDEKKLNL